jgi:hypothetical protein
MIECDYCKRDFKKLLVLSENIGKVYSVEGKDITYDYFKAFNYVRLMIGELNETENNHNDDAGHFCL